MSGKLIAEARALSEYVSEHIPGSRYKPIIDRLANELEAAEAKLELVKAIHRKYTYYELEDSCPDTTEEHREERHHESDEIGEFYCEDMPISVHCAVCRDEYGEERLERPCPTMQAIGDAK